MGCPSTIDLNPQSSNGQPGIGQPGPPVRLSGTVRRWVSDPRHRGPPKGEPLGGVEVQLSSSNFFGTGTGSPPLTTTTGSDGSFSFNVTAEAGGTTTVFYQASYGGREIGPPGCIGGIFGSSSAFVWVNWCLQVGTPTTLTLDPVYDVTVTTGSGGAQTTYGLLKGQLTDETGAGFSIDQIVFAAQRHVVTIVSGLGSDGCTESVPQCIRLASSPEDFYTDENGEFKDVQVELCSITNSEGPLQFQVTTTKTSCDNVQAWFGGGSTFDNSGNMIYYCASVSNSVSGIVVSCP
ncbi:MAG TPA: hypothetical protein VEB88_05125 [Candidatus Acidoferrales bacterium]|nr:hypothetical protein [Candidatus Acidoferrales bacterium]